MTTQSSSDVPTASNGTQLTLIAFIRAKKGIGNELGRRLLTLVEPARAEPLPWEWKRLHESEKPPISRLPDLHPMPA